MGTAKKTIKIPVNFGNVDNVVRFSSATIGTAQIIIPENSVSTPVTFTSAMIYFGWQDGTTAATSITGFTGFCTLAGASQGTFPITGGTVTNSGENQGAIWGPTDVLSYFTTNFGTSTTKDVTVNARIDLSNTSVSKGVYCYFEFTYEYDDTTANRIQTICLPWESGTGTLTTTAGATFCTLKQLSGTGGILSGYTGLDVHYRWLEIRGNSNSNGSNTDILLSYSFDGGATQVLPTRTEGVSNGADTWQMYQIQASGLTTNASHTFALWSNTASRFANIVVLEWITFEYTTAGTTRVLNYVETGIEFVSPLPGTTSAVDDVFNRQILINEPGPINMVKSGIEIFYNSTASATIEISAGAQASYRAYAQSSNVVAGMFEFLHGTDSDSALGAAWTLTRGENTITISAFRSVGSAYNITGVIRFLYESGVSSLGVAHHVQTNYGFMRRISFTTTTDDTVSDSFQIPQTNYWLTTANLFYLNYLQSTNSFLTSNARVQPGEGAGDGWRNLYSDVYISDNELGFSNWVVRARPEFKRYPNDPNPDAMNIETTRNFQTTSFTATRFGTRWQVAYTAIYFVISGTISGSAGGTVNIVLYLINTSGESEVFDQTTRTGNGTYSFHVYDDTVDYYVAAYESDTLKGLSKQATPTTGFDINLSGGGSSQTYGWAGG